MKGAIMAKKKPEELNKSEYGAYKPLYPEGKWDKFFYNVFAKNSPRRSGLNFGILTALIVFLLVGEEYAPWNRYLILGWLAVIVISSLISLFYWRKKVKKMDAEIANIEGELGEIQKELIERQEAFSKIKNEILDQE